MHKSSGFIHFQKFIKVPILALSVTSPLNLNVLLEAGLGLTAGAAARATELRKHEANDGKCMELGWVCVPMAVEAYIMGLGVPDAMESVVVSGLSPSNHFQQGKGSCPQ